MESRFEMALNLVAPQTKSDEEPSILRADSSNIWRCGAICRLSNPPGSQPMAFDLVEAGSIW